MKPVKDEWETVAREPVEAFAIIKRDLLQSEGIEAVLRGNKASGAAGAVNELNVSWGNPLGGIEVRVHRDDAPEAREILEAHEINRRYDDDAFEDDLPSQGKLGMEMWADVGRVLGQIFCALAIVFFTYSSAVALGLETAKALSAGVFLAAIFLFWAHTRRAQR